MDKKDRDYSNSEITVFWKPSKCIHATTCYRELIEVFNPRKKPWVNMEGASSKEIIRVVEMCPTQALSYKWNKDIEKSVINREKEENTPDSISEVRIMKNGPLILKGQFKIIGTDNLELKKSKMISLCRCGRSKNMPYCDGTHRKISFTDD